MQPRKNAKQKGRKKLKGLLVSPHIYLDKDIYSSCGSTIHLFQAKR